MIQKIYEWLIDKYGLQGWWPLLDIKGKNPTKTGSIKGYHPGDYNYPKTRLQIWEIIIGVLLTQNTSWTNVEKALLNLKKSFFPPEEIVKTRHDKLANAIKPAGYFNQKADRLKALAKWFINLKKIPTREELLMIKGIGPESADSILLYAYKVPSFVVDAYTKRVFINLGLISKDAAYDEIKALFEKKLKKDYRIYQEYHSLIVEHAKRYYSRKPYEDPLKEYLKHYNNANRK